jgi:hypothetical protein
VVRTLIGRSLVVLGVLGSGLTGMSAAQAVTTSDHLPPALAAAILAGITVSCLGGARLLLRRRGSSNQGSPTLDWEPRPGDGWLGQQAWAQLPDVLPRRPRLGPRAPVPHAHVPPDGLLRRLWLVRAELAFDQSGGMRASVTGWCLALGASAGLALLVDAFFATGDLTAPGRAAVAPILAWLVLATVISGERASRNPRRHLALRRMQRELETAYTAAPGPIPAGATVLLGDPASVYDPDRAPGERDSINAVRP